MSKITVVSQGSTPSSPASGRITVYSDSADKHLKSVDDAGLVIDLTKGSSEVAPSLKASAGTLSVGSAVYQVGESSGTATYELARADSASTMPAAGIVSVASTDVSAGEVVHSGLATGIDTSSFSAGDLLWVDDAVAGGLVSTEPTANRKQPLAVVVTSAVSGSLRVLSWGEYGLPNVADNNLDMGGFTLRNASIIEVSATSSPVFVNTDSDAAVDNKSWYWLSSGTTMSMGATSDNFAVSTPFIMVTRSGTTPTDISLRAHTEIRNLNSDTVPTGTFATTGTNSGSGPIYTGNRTPQSNVTADGGSTYIRDSGSDSNIYFKREDGSTSLWLSLLTFPEYSFDADQLLSALTADWAVNANAPVSADTNNSALNVRLMDDTAEEGFGCTFYVPLGARSMVVTTVSRAETAPGGASLAKLLLYEREIPDAGTPTAWSSSIALQDVNLGTNENWVVDTTTNTLAAWGLTAGSIHQIQITRTSTGNTLTGDLAFLRVRFSFI